MRWVNGVPQISPGCKAGSALNGFEPKFKPCLFGGKKNRSLSLPTISLLEKKEEDSLKEQKQEIAIKDELITCAETSKSKPTGETKFFLKLKGLNPQGKLQHFLK